MSKLKKFKNATSGVVMAAAATAITGASMGDAFAGNNLNPTEKAVIKANREQLRAPGLLIDGCRYTFSEKSGNVFVSPDRGYQLKNKETRSHAITGDVNIGGFRSKWDSSMVEGRNTTKISTADCEESTRNRGSSRTSGTDSNQRNERNSGGCNGCGKDEGSKTNGGNSPGSRDRTDASDYIEGENQFAEFKSDLGPEFSFPGLDRA